MDLVILIIIIISALVLVLFLPIRGARSYRYTPPSERVHEADAVLSRRLLTPSTEAYTDYYSKYPERKKADDKSRQSPGLLSPGSKYHHAATFAAARSNFQVIDFLGNLTHGQDQADAGIPNQSTPESSGQESANLSNPKPEQLNPKKTTRFISEWMKQTGAHSVGFTPLRDYHLYSHKGRGSDAGEPILKLHENAIAITVEMDYDMMQAAPLGSSVMESSEQYLRSGVLALKLAAFIRELGYEATAHIDGNYELICPLVAVDAGLGVIGRMGLLMTPDLGPRVRISVVSTNMPVIQSPCKPDRTTLHFCALCKKCVDNCPAAAIPDGPQKKTEGASRWQINSEKCYHFWTISGTDCGRCMTVCPFSHRNDCFHRFIRRGIKNNLVFRHLALKLDDVFYGRRPSIGSLPEWAETND
ncbi:MAG: 4Fe-4S dicluster domain-containing protein [Bacteroidetes bacterium]|nr:4Fe-4S dicluster domain-containing protein [Bacteroidota bacterium]